MRQWWCHFSCVSLWNYAKQIWTWNGSFDLKFFCGFDAPQLVNNSLPFVVATSLSASPKHLILQYIPDVVAMHCWMAALPEWHVPMLWPLVGMLIVLGIPFHLLPINKIKSRLGLLTHLVWGDACHLYQRNTSLKLNTRIPSNPHSCCKTPPLLFGNKWLPWDFAISTRTPIENVGLVCRATTILQICLDPRNACWGAVVVDWVTCGYTVAIPWWMLWFYHHQYKWSICLLMSKIGWKTVITAWHTATQSFVSGRMRAWFQWPLLFLA
jgi:hypothetical protein